MIKNIPDHSQIVRRLQAALKAPSHAYIFAGKSNSDKLTLAKSFAKALQCENTPINEGSRDESLLAPGRYPDVPQARVSRSETAEGFGAEPQGLNSCGQCLSCRVFDSGNHPDVFYVRASRTRAVGVDDVREQIVLPMSEKPFRYRYKVFIVEQAVTPQGQNALLKTIEEPASFGVFLILTENLQLLLPTVISRCVVLKLMPPADFESRELLDSGEFDEMRRFAQNLAATVYGMDTVAVFSMCSQLEKWKESIQTFLDVLYLCCREQLKGDDGDAPVFAGLDALIEAKKALSQNGNFQMTIEMMLLKMSGAI